MLDKESLKKELLQQHYAENEYKDILIVVKDQYDLVTQCINSIYEHTEKFNLYVWDNASLDETRIFLEETANQNNNFYLIRNEENLGFIVPNNRLAEKTSSPYIILLNSDTKVEKGWDLALLGYLQHNTDTLVVGYEGGVLNNHGLGIGIKKGSDIDYVCGWCLALHRNTYEKYGLFDENNLQFAYGEDSDFSLRIRESGKQIYALNVNYVKHYGHATIKEVIKTSDVTSTFNKNHEYIKNRWNNYLNK